MMPFRASYMWVVLLVSILFIIFFRVLFPSQGMMLRGGDIQDAYLYWKGYMREEIWAGRMPYWNPYNFSGTPFLSHPNINIFYPPNWLFVFVPLPASFAWYFFLHLCIAGISMYCLARRYYTQVSAMGASAVYALGGFFFARVYSGHLEYTDGAAWVPLALCMAFSLIDDPSMQRWYKASIILGILLLAGNELFFLFTMEMCALYLLYRWVFLGRAFSLSHARTQIGMLFLSVGMGVCLSSVGSVPRLQFIRESIRATGLTYDVAGTGSLPWDGLLLFIAPYHWGNPFPEGYTYHGPWPNFFEFYYGISFMGMILIGLGWFFSLRRIQSHQYKKNLPPQQIYWVVLIVISVWISLGVFAPINLHYLLWKYIPFYGGIRFPARHLYIVYISLCMLVGWGIHHMPRRWMQVLSVFAIVTNLVIIHAPYVRETTIPTQTEDTTLIERISASGGLYRMLPDFTVVSRVRHSMDFGASALHHIFSTSDYNSMILRRYYEFIESINGEPHSMLSQYNVEIPPIYPTEKWIDFLNIQYIVSDMGWDALISQPSSFTPVFSTDHYRLYQREHPNDRYFLVHDVSEAENEQEMKHMIRNLSYDPRVSAVVLSDMGTHTVRSSCDTKKDRVHIESYVPSKIEMEVSTDCDALLSSSEPYYPGWGVWIDGKRDHIVLSNSAFRSVYIPAGNHHITVAYTPWIFWIGEMISGVSICVMVYIAYQRKFL